MSAGTPEFRFPIYDQAKELVKVPHFGCLEGTTPPIFMSYRQKDGQPFISGRIVLADHNIPYDQYIAILIRAKKPTIPSYSTKLRIFRNDTVKTPDGQLLDASRIKRLSSFLFMLERRIVNYDTCMLEDAKPI